MWVFIATCMLVFTSISAGEAFAGEAPKTEVIASSKSTETSGQKSAGAGEPAPVVDKREPEGSKAGKPPSTSSEVPLPEEKTESSGDEVKKQIKEKTINREFGKATSEEVEIVAKAEKKKRAKEYFLRGELLFDGADYAKAAEAFILAYELVPHQAVLGNIALCYDKAGKWPDAVLYYRKYLKDPVELEDNESLHERLEELNDLVGEISVACELASCRIRVDGILREPPPLEVVVLPGEHRIEAVVKEKIVDSALTKVGAREVVAVEFKKNETKTQTTIPRPKEPLSVVDKQHEQSPLSKLGPWFWTAAGVTLVSAGVLAACGAISLSIYADSKNLSKAEETRGETYKLAANIMIGVTSTAAATSVVLAVLDLRRTKKKERMALTIAPGLGVGIVGKF